MPVVYHSTHFSKFNVEKFLLVAKEYVTIGIICVLLAMYLGLGLSLNSKLPIEIAYAVGSLPFVIILFWFLRHNHKLSFDGT